MHVVIIGNGISGITAARFIRKWSDHEITVISAETDYFFSRTALMYIYMGHMRFVDTQPYEPWFWKKNRIGLLRDWVEGVDTGKRRLLLRGRPPLSYDALIVAAGSRYNKFGWPGQDLAGVRGLYSYQDLEYMEACSANLRRAVIVGGGLIGVEMAEMFHSRHIPVTFLVREQNYWNMVLPPEESAMINRHIREHGIDLRLSTSLKEIVDDGRGRAAGVLTDQGEHIDCGYVGLTAGVSPNIDFLRDSDIECERGVLVDEYLRANVPDVYAIGDCAQLRRPRPGRRAIEAIWYTGRMMGETAAYNICKAPIAYDPGIWFNSAKFFDIEYQVYGDVRIDPPAEHLSLYWEHPQGRKSIRLVYHRDEGHILGFNLMGVRYRQEVCHKWLRDNTPAEEVLTHLGLANFDPEFFPEHEQALIAQYNELHGAKLQLRQRRGLSGVLRFLGGTGR
jgi:NADPH-dependent 2,4-dienoyl-CoA reductase/sulfur reductase-like enzyme